MKQTTRNNLIVLFFGGITLCFIFAILTKYILLSPAPREITTELDAVDIALHPGKETAVCEIRDETGKHQSIFVRKMIPIYQDRVMNQYRVYEASEMLIVPSLTYSLRGQCNLRSL